MAIAINGTGTLTGVSVGGLPNGIVDTDMLAANAVSTAKIADDAVTAAKRGTGGILQIIHGYYEVSVSSTSTSYVDTGLSKSITPLKTGSRIIVVVNQNIYFTRATATFGGGIKIVRDSTDVFTPAVKYQTWYSLAGVTTGSWRGMVPLVHYDNHGVTAGTATTYKTQMALHVNSSSGQVYSQVQNNRSTMTLIEVDV
tara:strand:- start:234 stop:827 length:594 start_codon:yes stop_codon:yes gene_type:complete